MATVAVLGTGIMGAAMARRLLQADHDVRVWNRTREKAEPLGDDGATVADSPEEAVRGADVVLTVLADADSVESVMRGEFDEPEEGEAQAQGEAEEAGAEDEGEEAEAQADESEVEDEDSQDSQESDEEDVERGPLAVMKDAVWVQMSTVGLEIDRLAELAEDGGITFVDAPVLGTKEPAEKGQLVVLAAGPDDARDACAPVFDAIGSRTMWVGDAGSASRLKLVTNCWIAGMVEALAESIALADAFDLDPELFLEAIEGEAVGSPYARIKGEMMVSGKYPVAFPLKLAFKDTSLVSDAAQEHGLDAPLARVVAGQFAKAVTAGHGDEDWAAVYRAVKED